MGSGFSNAVARGRCPLTRPGVFKKRGRRRQGPPVPRPLRAVSRRGRGPLGRAEAGRHPRLIAKLDQALALTPKQRDEIGESISSKWDETWAKGLQNYTIDDQYIPMVPDQLVTPFLDAEQKRIWTDTQKFSTALGGVVAGLNGNDGPLDDEFPDEIAREDPKPETKK